MVRKHLPQGYVPGPQLSPNNKKLVDQTGHSHSVSKNVVKTNGKTKLKNSLAHAINYDMPGNIEIYTHSIRHVVGVFGLEKKNRRAIFELKQTDEI